MIGEAVGRRETVSTATALLCLIRAWRKESGIEAHFVAGSANVSPKFISQLENGKTTVEIDALLKVTRVLGLAVPVLENLKATGQQIKDKRKQLELDQVAAAGLCNVSPRFLSTVENGLSQKKRLNKLFDVLKGFGVEVYVEYGRKQNESHMSENYR